MISLAQQAITQRVALLIGALSVPDVIHWADLHIEQSDVPHNSLIDISLGRFQPPTAIASCLTELASDAHDPKSINRAFGILAERVRSHQLDVQTAIINCYRFLQEEKLLYTDDYMVFINLEDDVSLIRDGIFGPDKLTVLQSDFLEALDGLAANAENAG